MFQFYKELQDREKHWYILRELKKLVKENKQALILIPEIFLTTQFKKRFEIIFWL